MSTPRYSSVDDYLEKKADGVKAHTIRAVIALVLGRFPDLESRISWNVPVIHRSGKYVAGMDAYKKHLTFSVFSGEVIESFRSRLDKDGYVSFKNCFQVPVDWQVDEELVLDLVRSRLAELDAPAA